MPPKYEDEYNNDPTFCPYCHSDNICADKTEYAGTELSIKVYCSDCFATWWDVYKFAGMEEDE